MPARCRAPGCGRFVTNGEDHCARHPDIHPPEDLSVELNALRSVLKRLLREIQDLEKLAVLVPRVTGASVNVIRTRYQIGGPAQLDVLAVLSPILEELDRLPSESARS
jgi:hypothetical protein